MAVPTASREEAAQSCRQLSASVITRPSLLRINRRLPPDLCSICLSVSINVISAAGADAA